LKSSGRHHRRRSSSADDRNLCLGDTLKSSLTCNRGLYLLGGALASNDFIHSTTDGQASSSRHQSNYSLGFTPHFDDKLVNDSVKFFPFLQFSRNDEEAAVARSTMDPILGDCRPLKKRKMESLTESAKEIENKDSASEADDCLIVKVDGELEGTENIHCSFLKKKPRSDTIVID